MIRRKRRSIVLVHLLLVANAVAIGTLHGVMESAQNDDEQAATSNNTRDRRKLTNYLEFGNQCGNGPGRKFYYEADIFLSSPISLHCDSTELRELGEFVEERFDEKVNEDRFLDEVTLKTTICSDPLNATERRLRHGELQDVHDTYGGSRRLFRTWSILTTWYGKGKCKLCGRDSSDDDTRQKRSLQYLYNYGRRGGRGPRMRARNSYSYHDPFYRNSGSTPYCGEPGGPTCQECGLQYGRDWCNGNCVWSKSSYQCIDKYSDFSSRDGSFETDWPSTPISDIIPTIEEELSKHLTREVRSKYFYDYYSCLYGAKFRFTVELQHTDDSSNSVCNRR